MSAGRLVDSESSDFRSRAKKSQKSQLILYRYLGVLEKIIRQSRISFYFKKRSLRESPESLAVDALRNVGTLLSLIGVFLVALVAYSFVFTGLQEHRSQTTMLEQFSNKADEAKLFLNEHPSKGQPIGILDISRIHLHQVVVADATATSLMNGPGWVKNTAYIGSKGNAVIAGRHVTSGGPFATIKKLRVGNRITVTTGLGKFTYLVKKVGVSHSGAPSPMRPKSQGYLTLVTSSPTYTPNALLYVSAKLASPAASAPRPVGTPPSTQLGLAGAPTALVPSILWGIVVLSVFSGVLYVYRRLSKHYWTIYVLTTPVLIMISLLWFENAFRLLPATL